MSTSDDSISRNAISGQSVSSGGGGGGNEGAPTAPSGLFADPQDWANVLTWTPGTNIAGQRIERSPGGANAWVEVPAGFVSPTDSGFADDIPAPNAIFDYRIVNLDALDNPGLTSNISTVLTWPAEVVGVGGTPAPDSITLTWTAPGSGAAEQRVERAPAGSGAWVTLAGGIDPAIGSYVDSGLPFTTAYDYRIVTNNITGSRTSAPITLATLAAPAPDVPPLPILPRARWYAPVRPSLLFCDGPLDRGGQVILDASAWASQCVMSKNLHGDRDLRFRIERRFPEALSLALRRRPLHVELVWAGTTIWEGRVTDPALIAAERAAFSGTALGYWHATTDTPIIGAWSDTRLDAWYEATAQDRGARTPVRFNFEQRDDLTIGPANGTVYTPSRVGTLMYRLPDLAMTGISGFQATVLIALPNNWRAVLARLSGGPGGTYTTLQSWDSTGAVIGPLNVAYDWGSPSADTLFMEIVSLSSATYTGGDGDHFFSVIAPRVLGGVSGLVGGATRDPGAIVRSIRQRLTSANPSQIADDDSAIRTVGIDKRDAVWEDVDAQTVLTELAAEGDGVTPWEVGVGRGRRLFFRPPRTGNAWGVIADDLELAQACADLANAVYATYQDSRGRTRRTTVVTNAGSIARFGLRRERMVASGAGNLTDAQRVRQVALNEWSDPRPQAGWRFRELRTLDGIRVPGFLAQPGDTITEIGITPAYDAILDRQRTLRIAEMSFDFMAADEPLSVVPEGKLPTLDRVIADIGRNA